MSRTDLAEPPGTGSAVESRGDGLHSRFAWVEHHSPLMLGVLVGLAAAIRFVGLTVEPLHIDEARQVSTYALDLGAAIDAAWQQNQPPLDHILGWVTSGVLRESVFSVRLPAALAGVATVAVFYLAVRRLAGVVPAVAAGLLLALLPMHVAYSQYARPYVLPMFAFGAGLWVVTAYLEDRRWLQLVSIVAIAVVLPWTRAVEGSVGLIALFVFVATAAAIRFCSWRRATEAGLGLAAGLISVAIVLPRLLTDAGALSESQGIEFGQISGTLRGMADLLSSAAGVAAALILLGGTAGIALLAWQDRRVPAAAAGFAASLALVTASTYAILYRSTIPLFDRYGTFFAPALGLAAALAVQALLRLAVRPLTSVVAAALVGAAILTAAFGTLGRIIEVENPAFGSAARAVIDSGVGPDAVIVYQPRAFNEFRPAYSYVPGLTGQPQTKFRPTQWISVDVRGLGPESLPAVIWFPPVATDFSIAESAEVQPPVITGYERTTVKRGGAEVYTPLPDTVRSAEEILQELSTQDPTSGRAWALLGAAQLAWIRGDPGKAAMLIAQACDAVGPTTEVDRGAVFGQWDQPPITVHDFVTVVGLPADACA